MTSRASPPRFPPLHSRVAPPDCALRPRPSTEQTRRAPCPPPRSRRTRCALPKRCPLAALLGPSVQKASFLLARASQAAQRNRVRSEDPPPPGQATSPHPFRFARPPAPRILAGSASARLLLHTSPLSCPSAQ